MTSRKLFVAYNEFTDEDEEEYDEFIDNEAMGGLAAVFERIIPETENDVDVHLLPIGVKALKNNFFDEDQRRRRMKRSIGRFTNNKSKYVDGVHVDGVDTDWVDADRYEADGYEADGYEADIYEADGVVKEIQEKEYADEIATNASPYRGMVQNAEKTANELEAEGASQELAQKVAAAEVATDIRQATVGNPGPIAIDPRTIPQLMEVTPKGSEDTFFRARTGMNLPGLADPAFLESPEARGFGGTMYASGQMYNEYTGELFQTYENKLAPPNTIKGYLPPSGRHGVPHPKLNMLQGGSTATNRPVKREEAAELFDVNEPDELWRRDRVIRKRQKELAYTDIFSVRNDQRACEQEPGEDAPINIRVIPRVTERQEMGEMRRMDQTNYDDGEKEAHQREMLKRGVPLPRFQKTFMAASQHMDSTDFKQAYIPGAERALTRTGCAENTYTGNVAQDYSVYAHGETRDVLATGTGTVSYQRAATSEGTDTMRDDIRARGIRSDVKPQTRAEALAGPDGAPMHERADHGVTKKIDGASNPARFATEAPATGGMVQERADHNLKRVDAETKISSAMELSAHGARIQDRVDHNLKRTEQKNVIQSAMDTGVTAGLFHDAEREATLRSDSDAIPYVKLTDVVSQNITEPVGVYETRARQPAEGNFTRIGDDAVTSQSAIMQESRQVQKRTAPNIPFTQLGDLQMQATHMPVRSMRTAQEHVQLSGLVTRVDTGHERQGAIVQSQREALRVGNSLNVVPRAVTAENDGGVNRNTVQTILRNEATEAHNHIVTTNSLSVTGGVRDDLGQRRDKKSSHVHSERQTLPDGMVDIDAPIVADVIHRHLKIARVDKPVRAVLGGQDSNAMILPTHVASKRSTEQTNQHVGHATGDTGSRITQLPRDVIRQPVEAPIEARANDECGVSQYSTVGALTVTDVRGVYECPQMHAGAMPDSSTPSIGSSTHVARTDASISDGKRIYGMETVSAKQLGPTDRQKTNSTDNTSVYARRL